MVGPGRQIVAETAADATHPAGHWQRSPDDPGLDAALLFPALRGAVAADDPRSVATVKAYARSLTIDGYAYRFRHDERPLGQAEGSFTLCGFLMALATHQQGDRGPAQSWWERTRASCGPPILYSEEYDTDQSQMRGNLPQAFVHALMLEVAATLGGTAQRCRVAAATAALIFNASATATVGEARIFLVLFGPVAASVEARELRGQPIEHPRSPFTIPVRSAYM